MSKLNTKPIIKQLLESEEFELGSFSGFKDSKSEVKIVSRSDHPPMQTVLIKVMGDNSSILFGSTVKRKEAQCVNIEIFGNNNKIGIDLDNFGDKSRVELRSLHSAEGNKIVIRGVRPDLIYAGEGVEYEIR